MIFNPTFTGIDAGGDNILSPGEIWNYEEIGIAVAGLYTNVATVTGLISGSATSVMDSDPSSYTGFPQVTVPEPTTVSLMCLALRLL